MTRTASRLLLVLVVLVLAAWLVVPLSSSPPPQMELAPPARPTGAVALSAEVDAIDREVERLSERLSATSLAGPPRRDPFQFAGVPANSRSTPQARQFLVETHEPVPGPSVAWPSLVAILSTGSDADPSFQVVLEDASGLIEFRSAGDVFGEVTVAEIAADRVTLTHQPSGTSTHVALR